MADDRVGTDGGEELGDLVELPRLPDAPPPEPFVVRPVAGLDPAAIYEHRPAPPRRSGSARGVLWVTFGLIAFVASGIGVSAYLERRAPDVPLAGVRVEDVRSSPAAVPPAAAPSSAPGVVPLPPNHIVGEPMHRERAEPADTMTAVAYSVVYWEGVDFDAPYTEYSIEYDRETDEAFVDVADRDGWVRPKDFYIGGWRYSVTADRGLERMRRTGASLEPGPDHRLARRLTQADVVPDEAVDLTLVATREQRDEVSPPITAWGVQFDSERFAADHPGRFADWLARWTDQDELGDATVDRATRQVVRRNTSDSEPQATPARIADIAAASVIDGQRFDELEPGERALIVIGVRADGTTSFVWIRDPVHDFMTFYQLTSDGWEAPALSGLESQDWVDAPDP